MSMSIGPNKSTMRIMLIVVITLLVVNTAATFFPQIVPFKAKLGLN